MSGSSDAAKKLSPNEPHQISATSHWAVERGTGSRCEIPWPSSLIKEIAEAFCGPWDSNACGWNIWVPASIDLFSFTTTTTTIIIVSDVDGCTEPGAAFGEVALLTDDGTRSASVIADQATDLIVIDRALYSRCIQDVIRREFQQKADFIAQHPHFRSWAPKYRKQLAMALDKEVLSFDHVVTKQGAPVDAVYFIISSVHSFIHTFVQVVQLQGRNFFPKSGGTTSPPLFSYPFSPSLSFGSRAP